MLGTSESILAAMVNDPNDVLRYLVYADALEDEGKNEHGIADYIRSSIAFKAVLDKYENDRIDLSVNGERLEMMQTCLKLLEGPDVVRKGLRQHYLRYLYLKTFLHIRDRNFIRFREQIIDCERHPSTIKSTYSSRYQSIYPLVNIDYDRNDRTFLRAGQAFVENGFITEVHAPYQFFMGGYCPVCRNSNGDDVRTLLGRRPGNYQQTHCRYCVGGQVPISRWANLFNSHPIKKIVITNLQPQVNEWSLLSIPDAYNRPGEIVQVAHRFGWQIEGTSFRGMTGGVAYNDALSRGSPGEMSFVFDPERHPSPLTRVGYHDQFNSNYYYSASPQYRRVNPADAYESVYVRSDPYDDLDDVPDNIETQYQGDHFRLPIQLHRHILKASERNGYHITQFPPESYRTPSYETEKDALIILSEAILDFWRTGVTPHMLERWEDQIAERARYSPGLEEWIQARVEPTEIVDDDQPSLPPLLRGVPEAIITGIPTNHAALPHINFDWQEGPTNRTPSTELRVLPTEGSTPIDVTYRQGFSESESRAILERHFQNFADQIGIDRSNLTITFDSMNGAEINPETPQPPESETDDASTDS